MTFSPDPAKDPANAGLVKKFTDAGITPEGYLLQVMQDKVLL